MSGETDLSVVQDLAVTSGQYCLRPDERSTVGSTTLKRLRHHGKQVIALVVGPADSRAHVLRSYAYRVASRVTSGIVSDAGDIRYIIDPRDRVLGLATFLNGHYEADVMGKAIAILEESYGPIIRDKYFIDVGANIGTTTLPALITYNARRVVAIEPDPHNLRYLKCNGVLNDVGDRIDFVHAAVSRDSGVATLALSATNLGDHRLTNGVNDNGRHCVQVQCQPLDEILEDLEVRFDDVGLLWIDTQGHEGHVLASARRLLQHRPPVVLEFWPKELRANGGMAHLAEAIEEFYGAIVDIRTGTRYARTDLMRIADVYTDNYTDLALLR